MRKISLFISSAFIVSMGALAQGSYVRFNVGYGLPMSPQSLGSSYSSTYNFSSQNYSESITGNYGSYGSGLTLNVGYGIALQGILGLDLEVSYLAGNENKGYSSKSTYTGTGYTETETYENIRKATGFSVAPAISLTAQDGKIVPYSRIGPVFGMYKMMSTWNIDYYENDGGDIYTENYILEEEYTGGISVGFKGSLGVIFNPTSNIQFFSEVNFVSMSFAPKQGKITKFTEDGVDQTDEIPPEYKEFEFKDKVTDLDFESDFLPIGDRIIEKHPLGSLALQVGIRFKLN
jgi:hypothetical protein